MSIQQIALEIEKKGGNAEATLQQELNRIDNSKGYYPSCLSCKSQNQCYVKDSAQATIVSAHLKKSSSHATLASLIFSAVAQNCVRFKIIQDDLFTGSRK